MQQWSARNLPPPPTPKQINDRFDYVSKAWEKIRQEATIDMRYATGDPWDQNERNTREGMGRLCLDFDELTQYVNQLVNGVRQNKRAPKVTPRGDGANDAGAEVLAGLIKNIMYASSGDAASITALENMAMRSYGYTKIVRRYVNDESDDQELCVQRIPNPDVIFLDPDAKEADFSDGQDAFEIENIPRKEFKQRFPKAQVTDFTTEDMAAAPKWLKEDTVQLATYWKAHVNERKRLRLDDREEPEVWEDELPEGSGITKDTGHLERPNRKPVKVRTERTIKSRFVVAYLFNGVEILEQEPWTITVTGAQSAKKITGCTSIPIVPYFGKELWVDKGAGTQRVIHSLIRMARTPYMAYCYTRTAQLEAIQLTSKSPYFVVTGQFEGNEATARKMNKVPLAYVEYNATTDATGSAILPPPSRPDYIPQVQELEVYAQAARAAIQSAIGSINPQAQRNSTDPLSGVAQQEFEKSTDRSTFHFIDNYDRAREREAQILQEAIPVVYDTARQISISGNDDNPKMVELNNPQAVDKNGKPNNFATDQGEFDVTISVGPSYDSQRDQANQFSDQMVANPQLVALALQNPQSTSAKLLAMAIRLKDLGPLGDAMAEAIDPKQDGPPIPPQVQQQVQAMQQQLQQAMAMVGNLQQELKEKTQIALLEMQNKRVIAADKNRTDMVIQMLKDGVANANLLLEKELERIEAQYDREHELSMAAMAQPPTEEPAGGEGQPQAPAQ